MYELLCPRGMYPRYRFGFRLQHRHSRYRCYNLDKVGYDVGRKGDIEQCAEVLYLNIQLAYISANPVLAQTPTVDLYRLCIYNALYHLDGIIFLSH